MRSQLLIVGILAAFSVIVGGLGFAHRASSAPSDPTMTVDADATAGGIQTARVVPAVGDFDIALEATNANTAGGYQWELQWQNATLDFVGATENTGGTGANLCVPPSDNSGSAPAGKEWWGLGSGCVRQSGTLPASVRLTVITLHCNVADGTTTEVHIVTGGDGSTGEDPFTGSTYLAPGGAALPTNRVDASITCGVPVIPTDTPTLTPTVTNTPTPTDTPPPTNTSTPTTTATPVPSVVTGIPSHDLDHDGLSDVDESGLGTCPGLQPKFVSSPSCHVGGILVNPLIADARDTDGDGLGDALEALTYHTNPLSSDTDGDGLPDGFEVMSSHTSPLKIDTDGDSLTDGSEINTSATSPLNPNTDGDGCTDSQELTFNHVQGGDRDPLSPWDVYDVPVPALTSSDPSGVRNRVINLSDVSAVLFYVGAIDGAGPNPHGVSYNTDLNGNGVFDGVEYDRSPASNPAKRWQSGPPNGNVTLSDVAVVQSSVGDACTSVPSAPLDDADGDGITDSDEQTLGTCPGLVPRFVTLPQCHIGGSLINPLIPDARDTDGDGLTEAREVFDQGTNPLQVDSDGDGLSDGVELGGSRTDPLAIDTDADTLSDGFENVISSTNPDSKMSDGDSCSDPEELGPNRTLGGDRDPLSPWDVFDVPVPALRSSNPSGTKDFVVTLSDVSATLFYVGARTGHGPNSNGVSYDDDVNGDEVPDGREYDRQPSSNAAKKWQSRQSDGIVTLNDVSVALIQVGDNCTAAP